MKIVRYKTRRSQVTFQRSKNMPRGIPNKKNENNLKKDVDTLIDSSKETNQLIQAEEKISAESIPLNVKTEELEYTTSPDGKYKFPKPKSETHSDFLEETTTNIPYFTVPGYVIIWPHDAKSSEIPNYVRKGYEFADPSVSGFENARDRPLARMMKDDGTPARHYCMYMSEGKFKEMKKREQDEIDAKEHDLKLKPSADAGIYATDQMSMAHAYKRRSGQ